MRKVPNNRGIALILVILMISVIVAVTIQLNVASRAEIQEAANIGDGIMLSYIAKSGFNGAEALLMEDDNAVDSLTEDWANAGLLSSMSEVLFSRGVFFLSIEDESGKLPINKLVDGTDYNNAIKEVMIRFLESNEFNLDEQQVRDIVDAIKDWIDEDDEPTGFGVENAYYKGLENPYPCKNGLLDSIDELLKIKGITGNIFYGSDTTPGLRNYVTVHGGSKININTAPPMILRALAKGIAVEIAVDMDEFRRDESNDLADASWYKDVTGMDAVTIDQNLITVQSDVFTIISTGQVGTMTKQITGVIKRSPTDKTVTLLSWKVD